MRNTATLTKLDLFSFTTGIENALGDKDPDPRTVEDVDAQVQLVTSAIIDAYHRQGKMVPANAHRQKLWWDQKQLGPIINHQNRARRWMLLSKLPQARKCYLEWQAYF